ncbi:DUF4292 domain-containing protein [Pedobacter sp.]|uniref:DUF4292 domain-containing protein n=1 Tax=Pedobacter sp. TaxID=1411316 RepID=UPI003D800189
MKRNCFKLLGMLGLLTFTFSACKTKKLVVIAPPVVVTDTVMTKKAESLKTLTDQNLNYLTLSMTGKAQLEMNGKENNVSVNIRMLKDKKIWMRVTAIAGLEVARVLVTPDSLSVLNRIDGIYLHKPFSYIHTYANKEVSFKLLQDLLAGNAPQDFVVENTALTFENGVWQMRGSKNSMVYQILFNTLLKAEETYLHHARAEEAVKVLYGNYQKLNGQLFPSTINLNSVSYNKKVNLAFDFSKIESNVELDFPFTVPKRFQVIN